MATRDVKVVFEQDMGKSIEFGTTETDKWNVKHDDTLTIKADGSLSVVPQQGGGLDCAAIGALPKREWKKGTTILAKQGSECVQLSALDSIFQEVGVGITANKTNGLTGETYHVVVTVTNTGEGTNDRTNLTITKPALGSYTTNNFTTSKSGANIARTDDWNYVITGLTRGGTAKVEFDVVPNGVGTFQFGASVNPNSALDQQSNNNRATLTLSATTRTAPAYVPSVDCPFITAKHGQRDLLVDTDTRLEGQDLVSAEIRRVNVIDVGTLNGVSITLANAKTVLVRADTQVGTSLQPHVLLSNGKVANAAAYRLYHGWRLLNSTDDVNSRSNVNGYTYDSGSGVLRFSEPYVAARIYVRAGNNCKWQCIRLTTVTTPENGLRLSTTAPDKTVTSSVNAATASTKPDVASWSLPWTGVTATHVDARIAPNKFTSDDSIVIRIRAGQRTSFTVTASNVNDYFASAFSQGNIQVSPTSNRNVLNVTVASTVSTADSFTYKNVRFEVV